MDSDFYFSSAPLDEPDEQELPGGKHPRNWENLSREKRQQYEKFRSRRSRCIRVNIGIYNRLVEIKIQRGVETIGDVLNILLDSYYDYESNYNTGKDMPVDNEEPASEEFSTTAPVYPVSVLPASLTEASETSNDATDVPIIKQEPLESSDATAEDPVEQSTNDYSEQQRVSSRRSRKAKMVYKIVYSTHVKGLPDGAGQVPKTDADVSLTRIKEKDNKEEVEDADSEQEDLQQKVLEKATEGEGVKEVAAEKIQRLEDKIQEMRDKMQQSKQDKGVSENLQEEMQENTQDIGINNEMQEEEKMQDDVQLKIKDKMTTKEKQEEIQEGKNEEMKDEINNVKLELNAIREKYDLGIEDHTSDEDYVPHDDDDPDWNESDDSSSYSRSRKQSIKKQATKSSSNESNVKKSSSNEVANKKSKKKRTYRKKSKSGESTETINWRLLPLQFRCRVCQELCPQLINMKHHIAQEHSKQQALKPKRHKDKVVKEKLMGNVNPSDVLGDFEVSALSCAVRLCPNCNEYIPETQISAHLDHHAPQVFCELCGIGAKNRSKLSAHKPFCTEQRRLFKCEICSKEYFSRSSLNVHHRLKHLNGDNRKHYNCERCGKRCRGGGALKDHMAIHFTVKPYECPDCGKGFSQKSNMNIHRRVHSGDKPYKCDMCQEAFAHNVSLKTHKKKKHGIDMWEK